jgi:peptidylprolyl isomerase
MTKENKTLGIVGQALARLFLLVGMAWLPVANAEIVASLGDVGLDADAVMRLLDQTDDSTAVLSEEQQRVLIFQNLLRKYLAKQAEEAGLPDQPEVAEKIKVLAEEAQLYSAYLRSLVPEATLTTSQVVGLYRGNIEQFQQPESVSVNQILLTQASLGSDFDQTVDAVGQAIQAGTLDFSNVGGDLGLSAEAQRNAALQRTVAVAELVPAVSEVLEDAAEGDAVGPIALNQGVAFLQLNERLPAGPRAFDEVEAFIRARASTALRSSRETAYIDGLVQANPIKLKSERSWSGWLEGKRLPRRPEKRVIAEMGAVEYSLGELLTFVEVLKTTGFNEQQLSEPEYLREQVVKARLIRKFLVEQAKATGFDEQPKVKAMVAEARRVVLADAWFAQLINDAVVAPDEAVIDDYYQKNISDYQFPAQVNMSQLLIEAGEGAEASARNFAASVQSEGANFKALAQAFSENKSGPSGVYSDGWTALSNIPANVFEQIGGLVSGDVSSAIRVAGGVLFIQVNEVRRGGVLPLDQVRERVEAEYVLQRQVAERNRRLAELQNALKY